MITVSTYTSTGSISAVLTVTNHDEAKANVPNGGGYILGSYMPDLYQVIDGVPVKVSSVETYEQKCASIRELRNKMLAGCDWTQAQDAPVDRDAWAAYRQALRDVSQQTGFPHDVVWPATP